MNCCKGSLVENNATEKYANLILIFICNPNVFPGIFRCKYVSLIHMVEDYFLIPTFCVLLQIPCLPTLVVLCLKWEIFASYFRLTFNI